MADNKHDQAATITRRSAMQAGTGAVLASGVPLFWSGEARADKAKVDAVLNGAVSSGNVPGVVAVAADDKGVIYEGAFGSATSPTGTRDDPGHGLLDRLDDQGGDLGRPPCSMVEQGKLSLDEPIGDVVTELSAAAGAGGLRRRRQPELRPPKRPITLRHLLTHTAGFAYDFWNKDIERYMKVANIPGIGTCKHEALNVPMMFDPGDTLGVRHQHRLGRQGGREGERPVARRLHPGAHLRPARHEGHRLHPAARPAGAPGERCMPANADGSLDPIDVRHAAVARILHGRRRPLLDRARLPALPAHAAGRRQLGRRADPQARDRRG